MKAPTEEEKRKAHEEAQDMEEQRKTHLICLKCGNRESDLNFKKSIKWDTKYEFLKADSQSKYNIPEKFIYGFCPDCRTDVDELTVKQRCMDCGTEDLEHEKMPQTVKFEKGSHTVVEMVLCENCKKMRAEENGYFNR